MLAHGDFVPLNNTFHAVGMNGMFFERTLKLFFKAGRTGNVEVFRDALKVVVESGQDPAKCKSIVIKPVLTHFSRFLDII